MSASNFSEQSLSTQSGHSESQEAELQRKRRYKGLRAFALTG